MAYYLKWPGDSGSVSSNNSLLEITGVTGNVISIQYTLKEDMQAYGSNRYLFDTRRLASSVNDGGDTGWFYQGGGGITFISEVSDTRINGTPVSESDFFTAKADDVCKFTVNRTPSGGAFSFGARFNEVAHLYGFGVSEIVVTDAAGTHTINMSSSNGTGSTLTSDTGNIAAFLRNFPADDSQWIYYDDGSSPEPVAQPVSLITAEIKNEALTLPISEALSVNLLTGEHVTNGYVLNLVSSQVGNATISEERHQASMLTVEQTASQSVISIAAEHLSEAQILTPIQHQRLNSIVAQQVEQALSASLSSIQALTFVVAEERQNAAPLTVEQYTGQLITLIVAEQREGAQTLLVSQVNKLDLVTAEQASDAQALSIKDLQKIKTIEVEQLTETEILHVLLSGDNTDLTGLRLQPVTPIYSITPIANSYSLNKV